MSVVDQFGFLPVKFRFDSDDFIIYPVDNFDELESCIKEYVNRDGFIYPPQIYSAKLDPITLQENGKIPNSERPAHLHKLPVSHNIEFKQNGAITKEELRSGIFGFIMHLIGYIYGRRLQFNDWWFDGRIPFKSQHNISISEKVFIKFITHSINKFNSWEEKDKKFFINILYMHNRVPIYEWDWERFAIEYMVFDACWKFSKLPKVSHAERIKRICEEYILHENEVKVTRIVNLRNDLFHEALWCNSQPCTASEGQDFMASNLRKLNQRIILALLGYESDYRKSNWTSISSYKFD